VGRPDTFSPTGFTLTATREADTVRLRVRVSDAQATQTGVPGFQRLFLQMHGEFRLAGRLGGREVADSGTGFFETYVRAGAQER
jgi:hypothetical protein